jgi:hypothetical protein
MPGRARRGAALVIHAANLRKIQAKSSTRAELAAPDDAR